LPHVLDVRNYGLIGAAELEPRAGKPVARAFEVFLKCFERGVMVRQTAIPSHVAAVDHRIQTDSRASSKPWARRFAR